MLPSGEDPRLPVGAAAEDLDDELRPGNQSIFNLGILYTSWLAAHITVFVSVMTQDPDTVPYFDEKDLVSDETLWALYERWCRFHEMARDHNEMTQRFGRFKDTAWHVYEFNKSVGATPRGSPSSPIWSQRSSSPLIGVRGLRELVVVSSPTTEVRSR